MTLLYTHPLFLEHHTGPGHPECPERLIAITEKLEQSQLTEQCARVDWTPATWEIIAGIHSTHQQDVIRHLHQSGGGTVCPDTVMSASSLDAAFLAVGAAISAVDQVVDGTHRNALCLVRPPGHHATPTQSMGFCLFNSIALAAHHARINRDVNRILIVDWDVHHGNGTQDVFYEDGNVTFFSIHRYGGGFYPGTGADHETGTGAGRGHNLNAPIRFGTSRQEYHATFLKHLENAAEKARPELILISAGFDAHVLDPIGSLGLETEDFTILTNDVLEVANAHADGRVVSLLEGGYNVTALAESVEVHLKELLRDDQPSE